MVRKWGWWQRPSSPSFTHITCTITPDSSAAHYVVALKQWTGDSKGQGRMSRPYPIYFSIPSFLPRVFHMSTFPCVVFPSSYPETFQVDNPYRAFVRYNGGGLLRKAHLKHTYHYTPSIPSPADNNDLPDASSSSLFTVSLFSCALLNSREKLHHTTTWLNLTQFHVARTFKPLGSLILATVLSSFIPRITTYLIRINK